MKAFSAFFMCPVSHTFPAYNGNVMPRRVSTGDACAPFYGLRKLFFLCGLLRQFARGRGMISPQCPGTPRVKPHKKSRLFSDRGAESFLWFAFLSGNSFFCARFCGVARAWKEPLPSVVFHPVPGRKSGFPGLCQPVAHACKPMPNPVIFRPKLSGFPRVAATTRGFSPGRTYQEFPARLHELMFVQENRERAVTLLWGSAPLFILF